MESKLIIEYIVTQSILLVGIYIFAKLLPKDWKRGSKGAYAFGLDIGGIGACILMSIAIYFLVFEKKMSLIKLFYDAFILGEH